MLTVNIERSLEKKVENQVMIVLYEESLVTIKRQSLVIETFFNEI